MRRRWVGIAAAMSIVGATAASQPLVDMTIHIELDLREDLGQDIGTLCEVMDESGRAVAGAGVVSVSNTRVRSDRRQLCVYIRPPLREPTLQIDRLPRPNADAGLNLFTYAGRLWAFSHRFRNSDHAFRFWDPQTEKWVIDDTLSDVRHSLGNGWIQGSGEDVLFSGSAVSCADAIQSGAFQFEHYGRGHLFFRQFWKDARAPARIVAAPWSTDHPGVVTPGVGESVNLTFEGEYPYCYGALHQDVLVGTSRGAVLAFNGEKWRTIVKASPDVSSQFYSILSYEDVVLLGHYPSGQLWSFDGAEVRQHADWPPVPPGASPHEREAQTMFIHAGELFVGVWPWGELWRMNREDHAWHLVARMFTHPDMDDSIAAPYAANSTETGEVYNRWGQRISGIAAVGEFLYVATSAKHPEPYNPEVHHFLSDGHWEEYGAVLRVRCGHNLAVPLQWSDAPTRIALRFERDGVSVTQDGRPLGKLVVDSTDMQTLRADRLIIGRGVYGTCQFPIQQSSERNRDDELE